MGFLVVVETKKEMPFQPSIGLYFPPVAFPAVKETLMAMLLLETERPTVAFLLGETFDPWLNIG